MSGEWGWEGHAGSMSTVSRQGGLRGPMRALAALVLLSSVLASPPAQHGGLERGSCSLARGGDNHMPAGAAKAVLMAAGRLPLLLPLRGGSSTATLKLERGGSKEVKQAERVSIARTVPLAPGVSMGGKHAGEPSFSPTLMTPRARANHARRAQHAMWTLRRSHSLSLCVNAVSSRR